MSDAFQHGDVVRLKSGGPLMTVEYTEGEGIGVMWFDTTNRLRIYYISPYVLVKVEHGEVQWRISDKWARSGVKFTTTDHADTPPVTLGEHTVTITGVEPLGDHGAQTLTVTGYGESELARRTRLAVQHAAEKYCVGRDAVTVESHDWNAMTRYCDCIRPVRMQLVRDLDGFAYARGRCTECNRVYVAVEPVA